MDKLCPICGVKLRKTYEGKDFCPNHGFINGDDENDEEEYTEYIG